MDLFGVPLFCGSHSTTSGLTLAFFPVFPQNLIQSEAVHSASKDLSTWYEPGIILGIVGSINQKRDMALALMGVSSLVGERDIKQTKIHMHKDQ